jgi:ABC-type transport system involved in multi-copper enzyme maturation permease subunit
MLGLVLLIATVRDETERGWRLFVINVCGVLGGLMILAPVIVGLFFRPTYVSGEGSLLLVLGLLYLGTFISFQDRDEPAYYAGLGLGAVGLLAVVGAIIRACVPETGPLFLVPDGLILIGAGLAYLGVAAGICLDWSIVVLTRRELASLFYSPVAYLVLVGMVVVGWWMFARFLFLLAVRSLGDPRIPPIFEPIVLYYVVALVPVIVQIFVVPAITMRLLAEEKRTGTLEVLLTAPVNEPTIVLSKFFAAWIFNLVTWVPWWLNLVALRYMADTEFDYRPILSFNVTLLPVTAGFIAMGLFFSSLTRNQIIAAVLTFVGMMAHLATYLIKDEMRIEESNVWYEILTYVSFLDLWLNSLQGVFAPRFLIFHLSLTIFFLYATTKILEARKWT